MKTHIVAIFNKLEGDNKLHCVLAENEVAAVKKAIIENCQEEYRTDDFKAWVNGLGETLEEVEQSAHEGELCISNVLTI